MARKTFVAVGHETDESGGMLPRWLVFRERRFLIDQVLDMGPAVAVNVGGNGLRYTVRIGQGKAYLFLDDCGRWFVEEKVSHEICRVGGLVHSAPYPF